MRFAEALAPNWLLTRPDAHAKNHALLLSGDQVRLAPLYDVASALPYRDFHAPKFRLAMKLGGTSFAGRVRRQSWSTVAAQLALDPDEVLARVLRLTAELPEAMASAVAEPEVQELGSPMPQRLAELVADRCAALAQRLT